MDIQKLYKNEINKIDNIKHSANNLSNFSFNCKGNSILYNHLFKDTKRHSIKTYKKRSSCFSYIGFPNNNNFTKINSLPKKRYNKHPSDKDSQYLSSFDIQKQSAKANDIKSNLSNSIVYEQRENKYKTIERKIQNKLLDISMEIFENQKNKINDSDSFEEKTTKIKKKKKKEGNRSSLKNSIKTYNAKRSETMIGQDTSFFIFLREQHIEKIRKIRRTKGLYDSMAEDESDENIEEEGFGLNPRSLFIDIFDLLLFICSLFSLIYLPLRLAKNKLIIDNDEYFILFMIYLSEIIYIFDLLFGFLRWYYNNELKIVKNNNMILKHYLSGYFLFDLIEAIPFYTILYYINSKNDNNNIEILFNEKYFLIKLLTCFKSIKIFKLNDRKNNRAIYFLNKTFSDTYTSERIYQISNFIIITISILNIFICCHIYIGKLSYPNWILSTKMQDKPFIEIYISSLYFIMATMSSVGYGDIVCINKEETCFQILLLSIGIVAYSWIINAVSDFVKNESKATIKYNQDIQQLEEIKIAYPNMPFKLYNNINQHLERLFKQKKKFDTNLLINSLPYTLKNKLLLVIHKEIINKFIFFKGCENSDFIIKILTRFIPIYSKKNAFLIIFY